MPQGEVPLKVASAAVRRIISLAYLIVWAWREHQEASRLLNEPPENRMVVLIDEVETHLHPRWQRTILPALLACIEELRKGGDVQIIASTHAPLVLASLETIFDSKKDRLFHLKLESNQTSLEELQWIRYGDVDNWLVSDVFNLAEPRSQEAEQAVVKALELLRRQPQPPMTEVESVDREVREVLGEIDSFLPRWSAYVEDRRATS